MSFHVKHEAGETVKAFEIGKKGYHKYVWYICPDCGKGRWVGLTNGLPRRERCRGCTEARGWGKHRKPAGKGYTAIKLKPSDFFYSMVNSQDYVLEHRLVMAQHLGRCLQDWEQVHHKDGNRGNNQFENLELTTLNNHISDHNKGYQDGFRKGLQDGRLTQITRLKNRITELESKVTFQNTS